MQLQQGILFRGCSHSIMFRLPRSLDPQIAPTAVVLPQGGRAVYTTHSSVGYLPRDVVSLRIRHKQLIRLDFHQLDCSLVGRSDAHKIITFYNKSSSPGPEDYITPLEAGLKSTFKKIQLRAKWRAMPEFA